MYNTREFETSYYYGKKDCIDELVKMLNNEIANYNLHIVDIEKTWMIGSKAGETAYKLKAIVITAPGKF